MPERLYRTPNNTMLRAVEYQEEGWNHAHHWYGTIEPGMSVGELIEEAANELLDAIEHCSPLRHEGHGRFHSHVNQKKVAEEVTNQILSRDIAAELEEIERKIRVYKRWGNKQPPKAVLFPDEHDPTELKLMVVDNEGSPYIYKTNKRAKDMLPPPVDGKTAHKTEFGWRTKRRWKGSTRLRRMVE